MTASGKPGGKRAVPQRKLTRPGKSAIMEKIGENQGRKTERSAHSKQDRLKRIQPFKTGMAT